MACLPTDTIAMTVPSADLDGDGVPDSQDAFPNDPKEWLDSNKNGIGDNAEAAAAAGQPQNKRRMRRYWSRR